jgi:hypothetical protein
MKDVGAGNAAFAVVGRPSRPLQIAIPQYALRATKGTSTPIIVIQAEDTAAGKTIGFKAVGASRLGVCPLSEVRLLGPKKPH